MSDAAVSGAAALAATLRDGTVLELLLRLQRGKPRTIEQIREIAPAHIDLGAALTALERVGLVRVDRDGLRVEPPEGIVAAAVSEELASQHRRLGEWRELLGALGAGGEGDNAGAGAEAGGDAGTGERAGDEAAALGDSPPGASPIEGAPLGFNVGASDAHWTRAFDGASAGVRAAIPDAGRVREWLAGWIASGPQAPPLDSASLLFGARQLIDRELRELLSALVAAGARVRIAGTVPSWLLLVPSGCAVLSAEGGNRPLSGTFSTEEEAVTRALGAVFDAWWASALGYPLGGGTVDGALALRGQGLRDEEAARVLGVSTRTLQRRLAQLMEEIGVRSRFELGAWWARSLTSITE
ncbi:MAG: hypothetical protein ACK5LO_02790 [Leucobacter sp.]